MSDDGITISNEGWKLLDACVYLAPESALLHAEKDGTVGIKIGDYLCLAENLEETPYCVYQLKKNSQEIVSLLGRFTSAMDAIGVLNAKGQPPKPAPSLWGSSYSKPTTVPDKWWEDEDDFDPKHKAHSKK